MKTCAVLMAVLWGVIWASAEDPKPRVDFAKLSGADSDTIVKVFGEGGKWHRARWYIVENWLGTKKVVLMLHSDEDRLLQLDLHLKKPERNDTITRSLKTAFGIDLGSAHYEGIPERGPKRDVYRFDKGPYSRVAYFHSNRTDEMIDIVVVTFR